MVNPRITIEVFLERTKGTNIAEFQKQLDKMSAKTEKATKYNNEWAMSLPTKRLAGLTKELGPSARGIQIYAAKTRIATMQMNTFKDGLRLMGIVLKDSVTLVGFMNNVMNIFISRFGTMILAFGIFRKTSEAIEHAKESWLKLDTAIRKVSSIVISSTGDMGEATRLLSRQMVQFGLQVGVTFEQMSDTMFFLASAGLKSNQVFNAFVSTMKLVVAASKDLQATAEENKKVVEIMAGLYNVYGETLGRFNDEQEKTLYIAGLLFRTFKTQQILLSELAVGLSFAASQAKVSGISLEELVATIGVLNSNLIKGSKAGTSYANAIRDATKNAGKLKLLFDIDIRGIGKDFSFLRDVIGPLKEQFIETGVGFAELTNLMEVWNVRGLRSVVVLIDKYEHLKQVIDDMGKGVGNLNEAFINVAESYKLQRQLTENIKTILGAAFSVAITGGKNLTNSQKEWNKVLKDSIPFLMAIMFTLGEIVWFINTIVRVFFRVVDTLALILFTINQIGEALLQWGPRGTAGIIEAFENLWERGIKPWARRVKGTLQGIERDAGGMVRFAEILSQPDLKDVADDLTSIEKKAGGISKAFGNVRSASKEAFGVMNDILKEHIVIFDTYKQEIVDFGFDSRVELERLFKVLTYVNGNLTKFGQEIDNLSPQVVEAMQGSFLKWIDYFTDLGKGYNSLNELSKTFHVQETNRLKDRLKSQDLAFKNTMEMMRFQAKEELAGAVYPVEMQQLWNLKRRVAAAKDLKTRLQLMRDFGNDAIIIIQGQLKDISAEFQRETQLFGDMLAGKLRFGFDLSKIDKLTIDDFIQIPDEFEAEFGLEKLSVRLKEIEPIIRNALKGVGEAGLEELRNSVDEFGEVSVNFTKKQKEFYIKALRESIEPTRAIIRRLYRERQEEALNSFKKTIEKYPAAVKDGYEKAKAEILKAVAGGETPDVEAAFAGLDPAVQKQIRADLDFTVTIMRDLSTELLKAYDIIDKETISAFLRDMGLESDELTEKNKALDASIRKLQFEMDSWANIAERAGSIMSDLAFIIGNEFSEGVQQAIDSIDLISNSVAQFIDELGRLQVAQKQATFDWVSFAAIDPVLGIIAAGASLIRGLISIFRKQKEDALKPLSEEILPEDVTRRIAPDFGQARVINQRITLTPIFQFLEASQLSAAQQRNLAFVIFDELRELQQAEG